MSVKQRLTEFAKSQERSVRAFEINAGLTVGYINAIRVSIQPDKLQCIASHYPSLNTGWLLTGEGEMLRKSGEKLDNSSKDSTFVPNVFSGLTDEQIEKAMEEAMLKKLLTMYEGGLIYSAASVKEYQQREGELMNENMKLRLEAEQLRQQLEKQQASAQSLEQEVKPTR